MLAARLKKRVKNVIVWEKEKSRHLENLKKHEDRERELNSVVFCAHMLEVHK